MSVEEFKKSYLLKKQKAKDLAPACLAEGSSYSKEKLSDIPTSFDWRDKGVISPIKDQGGCGSCWAFSVIGNIESQYAITSGNNLTQFSEQIIVDCSKGCTHVYNQDVCNEGCGGGWMWSAMYDVMSWGGVETEENYPYTAEDGDCNKDSSLLVAPVKNYTCLSGPQPADEEKMVEFIYNTGTLSIALNAELLMDYSSGIIDSSSCDPTELDHAVLIVGYGYENALGAPLKYFIVRNSWGEDWGEKGYFRIVRGKGCCGINTAVVSVVM